MGISWVGAIAILLLAGALLLWGWRSRLSASLAAVSSLLFLLLLGFYLSADAFTGQGIDESVLFHLQVGFGGAGFAEHLSEIAIGVAMLLAALGAALLCFRVFLALPSRRPGLAGTAGLLLLPVGLIANPAVEDLHALLATTGTADTAGLPGAYRWPSLDETHGEQRNLVVLYLESLEQTYFDETLFPGLMPELSSLQERGLTFTGVEEVYGTGWTIAGMVASQCGIPLITAGHGNAMSDVDAFLPAADCLGDLLAEQAYRLHYLAGASVDFAGKGDFYRTHGFSSVEGVDELASSLSDPDYLSSWGLYDDTLFELVEQRFRRLSESSAPFGLFSLTLDTHHPQGHVSDACAGVHYDDGSNPMLNAVHCADRQVAQLVRSILDGPHAENTVVAVLSDHLAMRNLARDKLQRGDRKNFFMLFSPDLPGGRRIESRGSMLDVGPTLLAALGHEVEGLGLGRNLLGDEPTLVEEDPDLNDTLRDLRGPLARLWAFPQLDEGLVVDPGTEQLEIGEQRVTLPSLLLLEEDLSVSQLVTEELPISRLASLLLDGGMERGVIWVDQCRHLELLVERRPDGASTDQWCLLAGRLGDASPLVKEVTDRQHVSRDALAEAISSSSLDEERLATQRHRLEVVVDYGSLLHEAHLAGDPWPAPVVMRSSGYGSPKDSAVWRQGLEQGSPRRLSRGVSLFGLGQEGSELVAHTDICVLEQADDDAEALAPLLDQNAEEYAGFAVVIHDSAFCESREALAPLFAGSQLEEWRSLAFRQPYVALLQADGEVVAEYLGEPGGMVSLRVRGQQEASASHAE
jgi:phosphoglycerol transferase